ncbi:conserved hypothetical protein [Histoplasma capsulatum var. duboisii H88]|uniref:FluG domain-containing protein n=1 Tax=Ajellomyces capsulatus (strain H88) TaxID=544711 RepID=F0UFX4_AJEC8|nr:conserved hypothetical protein [Histoplasma capsulatum var. duboisii H88]
MTAGKRKAPQLPDHVRHVDRIDAKSQITRISWRHIRPQAARPTMTLIDTSCPKQRFGGSFPDESPGTSQGMSSHGRASSSRCIDLESSEVRDARSRSWCSGKSLDCYWRVLKSLYVDKHGFGMDETMQRDCRNYKNRIIRSMGLRRRPKRKPSGNKDDIYRILIGHWARCTRVYVDEKQRLYVATGILLSYISGSRLVSLFDTRVEANDENVREGWSDGSSPRPADTSNLGIALKKNTNTLAVTGHRRRTRPRGAHAKAAPEIRRRNQPSMLKRSKRPPIKDDREPYDVKRPRIDTLHRTRRPTQDGIACEDITYNAEDSDPGAYSDSDDADSDVGYASEDDSSSSDTGIFAVNEPDSGTDVDTDTEAIASFVDSGYNTDNINDLDCYMDELDCSAGQVDIGELNRLVKEDRRKLNRFIEDVTDDEYDAGKEETATLLWRHIEFHIIRSPEEGRPNILLAKVTLLHTKGEDNKPRVHSPEPILDLLSHILSLAIDDEIFVADFPRFEDIYRYPIPSHLKDKAPSSVRDQVADHESNAVRYYLDTIIRFDLEAAAMGLPSNEVVQTAAHSLLLTVDEAASTELSDEQKSAIRNNPLIQALTKKNQRLTKRILAMGFPSVSAAEGKTPLYRRKMHVSSRLNSAKEYLRSKLLEQARKRHFRNADTDRFNQHIYSGDAELSTVTSLQPPPPPHLQIPERREIVKLMCSCILEMTEEERFKRRCESITAMVRLQRRREAQRRGRHKKQQSQPKPNPATISVVVQVEGPVPEKLDDIQCPFCVCDTSLPWEERMKVWVAKKGEHKYRNKLWNHIKVTIHREELEAYSSGQRLCGICRERGIKFIPSNIMEFKNHTLRVHGVPLRG